MLLASSLDEMLDGNMNRVLLLALALLSIGAHQVCAVHADSPPALKGPLKKLPDIMHNVSQTLEDLLAGYDTRLRPQFGGMHVFRRQINIGFLFMQM